jgi:predicted MFS family arabinose efflux permease
MVLYVQVWGWRSTFICLTIAAGVVVLPMLMLVVPETHQVSECHASDAHAL